MWTGRYPDSGLKICNSVIKIFVAMGIIALGFVFASLMCYKNCTAFMLISAEASWVKSISPLVPDVWVENRGQFSEEVLFYGTFKWGRVYITRESVYYLIWGKRVEHFGEPHSKSYSEVYIIREEYPGGRINPRGMLYSLTRISYFKGSEPKKWITDVPTYRVISLGEVYRGVELKFFVSGGRLKKIIEFEDMEALKRYRVKYKGVEKIRSWRWRVEFDVYGLKLFENLVDEDAGVIYVSNNYTISFTPAWGEKFAFRKVVSVFADGCIGGNFIVDNVLYSSSKNLLLYGDSVYVAGSVYLPSFSFVKSHIGKIRIFHTDSKGDGGIVSSRVFDRDIYVARFDADNLECRHLSYLGGSGRDYFRSIQLRSSMGEILIVGKTKSEDFPRIGQITSVNVGSSLDGGEIFITVLSYRLNEINSSVIIDVPSGTLVNGASLSLDGEMIYVYGALPSYRYKEMPCRVDFLHGSGKRFGKTYAGYIMKMPSDFSRIERCVLFSPEDVGRIMLIDLKRAADGSMYAVGISSSMSFPQHWQIGRFGGLEVAFVLKIDSALRKIISSYILTGFDEGNADLYSSLSLEIGPSGEVYIGGSSLDDALQMPSCAYKRHITYPPDYEEYYEGNWVSDVFVVSLDRKWLRRIEYGTYIGCEEEDTFLSMDLANRSGDVYILFETASKNLFDVAPVDLVGDVFKNKDCNEFIGDLVPEAPGGESLRKFLMNCNFLIVRMDSRLSRIKRAVALRGGRRYFYKGLLLDGSGYVYILGGIRGGISGSSSFGFIVKARI